MTGPDFADQARRAFDEPCSHCDEANSFTCCAGEREPNNTFYWVTAGIVAAALIVAALAMSETQPCDFEFWGGLKVGLGAACQ